MTKKSIIFLISITVVFSQTGCMQTETVSIIPRPVKIDVSMGTFTISPQTVILVDKDSRQVGEYLGGLLRPATGFELKVKKSSQVKNPTNCIILQTINDKADVGTEGYQLQVFSKKVLISAAEPAGLFYGCQSLRQLLPSQIENKEKIKGISWHIPKVKIQDRPRYRWRGMHLDVGRHFFGTEFVKKYIDLLALYKFNRFHWHLTEDQGWRVEIKKYPKLAKISAWRKGKDGKPYGGFYTQEQLCDIVEYAKARFITVVPEIEMPGHTQAVLAAYPELSCTGGPFEVATEWGIREDVYCAGNDQTFEFLENVLGEVIEIFPSQYVHIGGDECPKDRWKACPKCQARIKIEGLKDEHELQSYFIKRISRFLTAKNKKAIGWDEILEGGLAADAAVMSWRGTGGGIAAAQAGHDVVMCPLSHCYFNYEHPDCPDGPGHDGGGIDLRKVYLYEPTPLELTAKQATHILGTQGNVWTEYISTNDEVEFMAFPRACAIAEVAWSAKHLRDWDEFSVRLKRNAERLDKLNVNFHRDPVHTKNPI